MAPKNRKTCFFDLFLTYFTPQPPDLLLTFLTYFNNLGVPGPLARPQLIRLVSSPGVSRPHLS